MSCRMAYHEELEAGMAWYADLAGDYQMQVREGTLTAETAWRILEPARKMMLALARAELEQFFRVWEAQLEDARLAYEAEQEERELHAVALKTMLTEENPNGISAGE